MALTTFLSLFQNVNKPLRIVIWTISCHKLGIMDAQTDGNLDRFERKAIIEAEKRKKPGECLKVILIHIQYSKVMLISVWIQYVQAIIDERLANEAMGARILAISTINCKTTELPVPRTIYWRRSVQQILTATNNEVRNNTILVSTRFLFIFAADSFEWQIPRWKHRIAFHAGCGFKFIYSKQRAQHSNKLHKKPIPW